MKRTQSGIWLWLPITALAVLSAGSQAWAAGQVAENPAGGGSDQIEVLPIQKGAYLLAGAGGNIVAQVGPDGILLVDSGTPEMSEEILAALGSLTDAPIRYVINTSVNLNHTGGNEFLSLAGANEAITVPGNSGFPVENAPIIAREETYFRIAAPTETQPARPFDAWPTSTFFSPKKTMYLNGEGIEILHQPEARTDGDLIVFFRGADVIAAGDVFVTEGYPMIDLSRGGSIQGLIDAANHIIDIAIPRFNQQGGTLVVPGHGRISNEADVVEYRDMLTIIRERVERMIGEGMTPEQVRAAGPTLDYDGVYGTSEGPWTTDMFIEAVYQSLQP